MYFLNVECGRLCCLVSFAQDPGTLNLALQPGSVASNPVNGSMITPGVIRALPSPLGSAQAEYQGNLPSSDGQNPAGTYQTKRHRLSSAEGRNGILFPKPWLWLATSLYVLQQTLSKRGFGCLEGRTLHVRRLRNAALHKKRTMKISCHLVIF